MAQPQSPEKRGGLGPVLLEIRLRSVAARATCGSIRAVESPSPFSFRSPSTVYTVSSGFPPLPKTTTFFSFFFPSCMVPVRLDPYPYNPPACLFCVPKAGATHRGEQICSEGVIQVHQSGGRNLLPFLARSLGNPIPLHPDSPLIRRCDEQRMAPLPTAPTRPPPHGHGSCV